MYDESTLACELMLVKVCSSLCGGTFLNSFCLTSFMSLGISMESHACHRYLWRQKCCSLHKLDSRYVKRKRRKFGLLTAMSNTQRDVILHAALWFPGLSHLQQDFLKYFTSCEDTPIYKYRFIYTHFVCPSRTWGTSMSGILSAESW